MTWHNQHGIYIQNYGGMAEWFKAAVLKTVECHSSVGSNPTPSARRFNVVKSHHWLVASSSWQRGFPQYVDVTSKNLMANSNLLRDSMKFRFKEFRVYKDANSTPKHNAIS